MEVNSPSEPKPERGGNSSGQVHTNKQYSFKDEHIVSLFKLLNNSNKLKLSEARHLKKVGKINNPNYCLYHQMLGHPTKSCYIFKDVALIDEDVLKLCPEQKMVTTNMTSIQFGKKLMPVPAGVVPIPKGELRVINIDPHHQGERVLSLSLLPKERSCGFIPISSKGNSGLL